MHANYVLQKMRSRKWSVVVLHFLSAFLSCLVILILSSLHGCSAGDTISIKNSLVDGETLVSAGNRFELGFFTPSGNSNVKRYVGIWYVFDPHTVVWVANRRKPLSDKTGVLHIADGYLKLTDKKGNLYWSTNYQYSRLSLVATLDDNGNLIMYANDGLGKSVWPSFDHPTDTFLYGMKMDENFVLTSWTSDKDPAPGNFTLKQEGKNQLVVEEQGITYWRSSRTASTNLIKFDDWPSTLDNFFNFSQNNTEVYRNDRMVMSYTGDIQYWRNWSLVWWEPKDKCSKYNFCGNFGSCNSNNKLPCKCLPGFKPKFSEKWNAGEYSDGCSRNSTSCGNDFLKLKRMKVGSGTSYEATDNKSCSEACLSRCQCQAYSFTINMDRTVSCLIWTDELRNLQEDREDGYDLYVRVAPSDIESTSRNCETCGTNLIPYPLSTGPNCGDPMYYNFNCNNSKDQLSFMTDSGNYNVTSVDQEAHIFVIEVQAKEAVKCDALPSSGSKILQLNHSLPFYVTSNCSSDVYSPLNGTIEVKISWKPPLQPTCNSSADCKDWPYSSCDKRGIGQKRCHCNNTFYWDGLALNCTPVPKQLGVCFNKSKTFQLILSVSLPIAMALLCTIFTCEGKK